MESSRYAPELGLNGIGKYLKIQAESEGSLPFFICWTAAHLVFDIQNKKIDDG